MSKDEKDPLKRMEWKAFQEPTTSSDSGDGVVAKKRVRKKLRQIPDHYFLPRKSLMHNLLFFGGCIAGGIGAGMLTEIWINKKVEEDGGVIWEFDKK